MKTIGIIGGGQLGRMMSEAAKKIDCKVVVLDPQANCSASFVADQQIIAGFNIESITKLATKVEVITYEFENIPYQIIKNLAGKYDIPQFYQAIYVSQNRFREKQFAQELGIKTTIFRKVSNKTELLQALSIIGYPVILKTCEFGYDGKGQVLIKNEKDLCNIKIDNHLVENLINFDYEISVILSRDKFDNVIDFPIPLNIHKNGILHKSIVPSGLPINLQKQAISYAKAIIKKLNYIGTMAVEFFVKDQEIIFNEFAPRPHNSGHYTLSSTNKSQFDLHIEALIGNKIKPIKLLKQAVMVNILGQDLPVARNFRNLNGFYLYQKSEITTNRKMGHINFTDDDLKQALIVSNQFKK